MEENFEATTRSIAYDDHHLMRESFRLSDAVLGDSVRNRYHGSSGMTGSNIGICRTGTKLATMVTMMMIAQGPSRVPLHDDYDCVGISYCYGRSVSDSEQ